MFKRALLLASLLVAAFVFAAYANDGSIVITTSKTSYPGYSGGYSGSGQTGMEGTSNSLGSGQQSSDPLLMYQEYYYFDQGGQSATGPTQYESEPTYLIINGQSRPYDSSYVPTNSLWIQGKTSWTQYIKCPLGAWYRVLAVSYGGPATMVETYPTGYQDVKNYNFIQGYTPGVFEADTEGRHVLIFYINGQKSNSIIVDVVPYSGTTLVNNPPSGQIPGQIQCDITGTWNFGTNGPYNIINADGTIVAKQTLDGEVFDSGAWYVIDASKRQYGFSWQGGWKHTFTLSADCSSLNGTGRLNGGAENPDHATRVTSGQSGGYSTTSTGNVGQNSGQKSGCPCAGEKCLCPSDKCNGNTFPQFYGTIIGKQEKRPGYLFEGDGPCYCDCDANEEYWKFLIETCHYVISGHVPPETECSGAGVDSGNIGTDQSQAPAGSNPFATGGILTDGADQGFDPNEHIGGLLTDSS